MQKASPVIEHASFISIWDGGSIELESDCQVNLKTHEVFAIDKIKDVMLKTVQILDSEFIELHGKRHRVKRKDDAMPGEFWYQ